MNDTLHCPLCGFQFAKADTVCTHGCPLGKFCKLIKCPSCQYEFPEPSRPLRWLAALLHPPARLQQGDAFDLGQLAEGETAEFVGLAGSHASRQHTLGLYGLAPGARLTLQQKRPAYVVRVGETELALDDEIARGILVRRVG